MFIGHAKHNHLCCSHCTAVIGAPYFHLRPDKFRDRSSTFLGLISRTRTDNYLVILHKSHGKACPDIAGTANESNLHARGIISPLFYSFALNI